MVLIISESTDISTNHVIEWITSFGYPFLRINWDDKIELLELNLNTFSLIINGDKIVRYDEITSVWFRRGDIKLDTNYYTSKNDDDKFKLYLSKHLKMELNAYSEYINYLLLKKKHLGNFDKVHINKFLILDIANKCGLKIPETKVVSNRKDLEEYILQNKYVITKSSNYVLNFEHEGDNYMTYTELIEKNKINDIPEKFAPSLCQKMIKKVFDIRIFFIDNYCYAMAIFSQRRKDSKVDFRKYDYDKPDRCVPYKLSNGVISKIMKLMKLIGLNTGSIDMVLDEKGQYYFLEVNPVGQFGMVEFPCNYMLNKKIAEYLVIK